MANSMPLREIGIPVRSICSHHIVVGRDAGDNPCLYISMGQHSAAGGCILLQVDPSSGVMRQFNAPPEVKTAGIQWLDRRQCLLVSGSPGPFTPSQFFRFDPKAGRLEALPFSHPMHPHSSTPVEAPNGCLYLLGRHACAITRYDLDTGNYTHLGCLEEVEQIRSLVFGADGTCAALVSLSHPRVIVLDLDTLAYTQVGPVADTDTQTGLVSLFKGEDGMAYIESHEGYFAVRGAEAIPVESAPARLHRAPALPDGSTIRFLDGWPHGTDYRQLELTAPNGDRRVLTLEWEGAGTNIYLVRPGPDGKLYGSSILPLHFFSHDPATGALTDHGVCCTSAGEIYSMDSMDGLLYFCAYTHGLLGVYDPAKPYRFDADKPDMPPLADAHWNPEWPTRFGDDPEDNPRQLGRMDAVAYRPRDMLCGPDGKVWVASIPDYGMLAGTLSWYDPRSDRFGGAHRHILPDCSPQALTYLPATRQLVVGFTIYGGDGARPRADRAGLVLWDPGRDEPVWRGDFGLEIVGVMDLEYAGDGLVYAVVHPAPADRLHAELLLLDFASERIVSRASFDDAGWPLEVSFQRDARYLYGATRRGIYRVPLGSTAIEMRWTDDADGPSQPGALLNGSYYFARKHRLCAIDMAPDVDSAGPSSHHATLGAVA